MQKSTKYWLLTIFIITLATRLILSFYTQNFTYESYFHLRQVEHITGTGLPLYQDLLSYGGRELVFLPAFHYLAAFFDLFLPIKLVAKILPNLFLATLTILVFLIAKRITNNDPASLLSAFIAGFLPILFATNSFTIESLFLPLVFLTIYTFLRIKEKKYLYLYIFSFLILSLTSSATSLIIIGFGIYLALSLLEGKRVSWAELELIIFSLFLFIWVQFLFYKETLLKEGIAFIWQNIPTQIIQQYFPQISIFQAIILVSVIPFLAGTYIVYKSLFQLKGQKAFLLISLAISTTLLAWLRLIQFKLSLTFFGLILAILFASFYQEAVGYLKKTKLAKPKKILVPGIIIVLLLSTIYPAVSTSLEQETPTNEELAAFQWLNENVPQRSGVLSLLKEGHLVTYYSQRKNLMDDQFNLIKNIETRFENLNSLFITRFQTQALSLLDKYNIRYLVITPHAREVYQMKNFAYLTEECFDLVYDQETKIYLVHCILA